mmetsp:Transcript_49218/g.157412  ORF Transcript_49218/g.157412 Transcript_49218/m.157412 type:complete len:804 (-) Transcript_49218:122-2533(-)
MAEARCGHAARWLLAAALALAASAAPSRPPCPVRVLEVETAAGEGLRLVEAGLRYLESLAPPVYVVPVLGVYRGGKSLLMNRVMQLRAPYEGGFGVGHGQHTFTRGVDACAEHVQGLGTVVWMDTEGLWSAEDARAAYGPKIFSFVLLFSSSVLLNNVKVLNDQFFAFFSEQQQVARMLKRGLVEAGLPEEQMLPRNLTVTWIVQQPVQYGGAAAGAGDAGDRSRAQLESFLAAGGDEAREHVRQDYHHGIFEVPVAVMDVRLWRQLDQVPDERLNPEYVAAAGRLRGLLLEDLRHARAQQARGLAEQLRMLVQAVRSEEFSGALAREAFEAAELGGLCGNFSAVARALAGPLPSGSLAGALATARLEAEQRRLRSVRAYHLAGAWSARLERCLEREAQDLGRQNEELLLESWEQRAGELAERGACFFLPDLARLREEYSEAYGHAFGEEVQARAHDFAAALQSTRLAECVRLYDLILPFAPWLVWPVLHLYIRERLSGLITLLLHAIGMAGLYVCLQSFGHLPAYFDSDYPVLRSCPRLLEWVLWLPLVPWARAARLWGVLGAANSAVCFLRALPRLCRPVGDTVGQLVNLELKINGLAQRSSELQQQQAALAGRADAALAQQLVSAALGAAAHGALGDGCAGAVELLKGLGVACALCREPGPLRGAVGKALSKRAALAAERFDTPAVARGLCGHLAGRDLTACALKGEWARLLQHMVEVAEAAAAAAAEASEPSEEASSAGPAGKAEEAGGEELSTREDSDDSEAEEHRERPSHALCSRCASRQRHASRPDWQDYEYDAVQ